MAKERVGAAVLVSLMPMTTTPVSVDMRHIMDLPWVSGVNHGILRRGWLRRISGAVDAQHHFDSSLVLCDIAEKMRYTFTDSGISKKEAASERKKKWIC